MRIISAIAILLISWSAYSQGLKGYVEDGTTHLSLHGAHIQNLTSKKLVTTAPNGTFDLPVEVGDSLLITYIGYEDYSLVVEDELLEERLFISLKPAEVTLDDVVVTPFPEYSRFKQMIIDTDPPDSSLTVSLPKVGKYAYYDARTVPIGGDLAALTIGIPFDLEGLTKRGKEKKKLKKKLEMERKWRIARQKFNRDWVGKLTKLEGDELTDFIAFCDFSVEYLVDASLIDIQDHVMTKLEKYQAKNQPKGDNYSPGA